MSILGKIKSLFNFNSEHYDDNSETENSLFKSEFIFSNDKTDSFTINNDSDSMFSPFDDNF